MNKLKAQADFVEALFLNLILSVKEHIENKKNSKDTYWSKNYMNRNCGKYALKRKITALRQELLNLERMLDNA